MRHLIIATTLLLVAAIGLATDKNAEKGPQPTPEAGSLKERPRPEVEKKSKAPEWPRPYKSTEEISVDSTVPFPTDI